MYCILLRLLVINSHLFHIVFHSFFRHYMSNKQSQTAIDICICFNRKALVKDYTQDAKHTTQRAIYMIKIYVIIILFIHDHTCICSAL